MELKNLDDTELVNLYPQILRELKERNIIRTNNLTGELGEYFAEKLYKENAHLSTIQLNLKGTKNIDATSRQGERYAIKSRRNDYSTGVFHSLPTENDGVVYFEYLIFIIFNDDYLLKEVYELTWDQFLRYRRIKKPENKFFISLNQDIRKNIRMIYP